MTIETLRVVISAETAQLNNALKTAKKSVNETQKSVKQSSTSTSKFASQMAKKLSLTQLAVHLVMRAIQNLGKAIKNGLSNLYKFSDAFGGDFSKNIDSLRDSLTFYQNSLGSMFAPLLNVVVPILTKVLKALADVNNELARTFAILAGQEKYIKAKYLEDIDDSLNNVLATFKKLKRAVAGFDELNILNNGDSNFANMFSIEEADVDRDVNSTKRKFLDAIEEIKTAFVDFWNEIKTRLEKLWNKFKPYIDKYKGVIEELFSTIKEDINPANWGLTSPFFLLDIGLESETVDAIINGIPTALRTIKSLSDSIKAVWQKFGDIVKDIWDTIGKPIDNVIAGIITTIVEWLESEEGKEVINKIKTFIENITTKIENLWKDIKPKVEELGKEISKFWEEDLKPLLKEILKLVGPLLEIFSATVIAGITVELDKLKPVLKLVLDLLKDIFKILGPIVGLITDIFKMDFDSMDKHIRDLLGGIEQVIIDVFFGIIDVINGFIFGVRDALNFVIDGMNAVGSLFGSETIEHLDWKGIDFPKPENATITGYNLPITDYSPPEGIIGPVAGPDWNASDYFDTTDNGALTGSQNIILEVDGQALGRASLTNINRLSRQAGYVNLNLAY